MEMKTGYTDRDAARLAVVRAFADNVLEYGKDRWSGRNTPLLADGIVVHNKNPVVWRYQGKDYIIHNLASQQNLFRVLAGLSGLTGEARYKQAATDAFEYHFKHLAAPCGKLRWGGHQFIDLATLEPVGHFDADCHEFKWNLPFYRLMWEVDGKATAAFIRALWAGHVTDWRVLEMNRHARYGEDGVPPDDIWDEPFDDPEPYFESRGLSFLNCGADLIYAAGMLYGLSGERRALDWGGRLAGMYTKARHPETGMGAFQYTKPLKVAEPPAEGPLDLFHTSSFFGDRLENQFAHSGSSDPDDPYYNPIKEKMAGDGRPVAREGWAFSLIRAGGGPRYHWMLLHLAESLGEEGTRFAEDAADAMEAHAVHAYDPENNRFRAMWADGTDVTGLRIPRTGYHGTGTELGETKGDLIKARPAGAFHLMTYARAFRLTGRDSLWHTARSIAKGLTLGDIGAKPGENTTLDSGYAGSDPMMIFALIELYRAAPAANYIALARHIADTMIERRFHHGFFMPSPQHVHADFDSMEPLAILALDALLRGEPDIVPAYPGGRGYIHGRYDGHGRTYDSQVIWSLRMPEWNDHDDLARIALENEHAAMRRAALDRIEDTGQLARIAESSVDQWVVLAALAKMPARDQGHLARIVKTDEDSAVVSAALAMIDDSEQLARIVMTAGDEAVGLAALAKMPARDQEWLAEVAAAAHTPRMRRTAMRRLTDTALRTRVAMMEAGHVKVPRLNFEVEIDGDLSAWKAHIPGHRIESGVDGKPLQADIHLAWDDDYLYAAVCVRDENHFNTRTGGRIWDGDSFQLAIDPLREDVEDAFNLGIALAAGRLQSHQWNGPDTGVLGKSEYRVVRDAERGETRYEMKIPFESIKLEPAEGAVFGFNAVVFDDADGAGYDYWIEMTPGLAGKWDPEPFRKFILTD